MEANYKETSDLSFAAYAMLRKLRIVRAEEVRQHHGGSYQYSFLFECPDDRWDSLHLEFANSEISDYDAAVRNLKRLCKRRRGVEPLAPRRVG